jgi:hypothetical protein
VYRVDFEDASAEAEVGCCGVYYVRDNVHDRNRAGARV